MATVAYVAPELVTDGRADPRTDVYSAGIVLFEMLTGRVPYDGDRPVEVAWQHVDRDVPPPSLDRRRPAAGARRARRPAPPAATRAAGPPTPARCSPRCRRSARTSATPTPTPRSCASRRPDHDDGRRSTRTSAPPGRGCPARRAEPPRPGRRRSPQARPAARRGRAGRPARRQLPPADEQPARPDRARRRDRRAGPGARRRRLVVRLRPLHGGARSWSRHDPGRGGAEASQAGFNVAYGDRGLQRGRRQGHRPDARTRRRASGSSRAARSRSSCRWARSATWCPTWSASSSTSPGRSCSRPSSPSTQGADRYSDSLPKGIVVATDPPVGTPSSSPTTGCS